jgi:predicted PolB exonuclease-like 3'-5' exonuclease
VLKTSFDGGLGHIAVIGVAIDNEPPIAFFVDSTEPHKHEAKVLSDFFAFLAERYDPSRQIRPRFIGHNIVNFDLRFMFQRAVVLGIKPPPFIPFNVKPWDDTIYDTMTAWAGFKGSVKLDTLAKALGLPGKQGVDGSQVWSMVAAGRIKEVADYCANTDVAQTRDVYRRLTFQGFPAAVAEAA